MYTRWCCAESTWIPIREPPARGAAIFCGVPKSAHRDVDGLEPSLPSSDGGAAGSLRSHLREMILGGLLQPGVVISQVELAHTLGVSRTPLREAMRMLQEEGLIEAEPNRRAR